MYLAAKVFRAHRRAVHRYADERGTGTPVSDVALLLTAPSSTHLTNPPGLLSLTCLKVETMFAEPGSSSTKRRRISALPRHRVVTAIQRKLDHLAPLVATAREVFVRAYDAGETHQIERCRAKLDQLELEENELRNSLSALEEIAHR